MMERWVLAEPPPAESIQSLVREFQLTPTLAGILVRRGFSSPETVNAFLCPRLGALSDPFLLPDMGKAVERILAAVDGGERMVFYGDYDVDGVASLAMLQKLLTRYGAKCQPFIPKRLEEGYGMGEKGLARCLEESSPQLLIAVDCGTTSVEPIRKVREAGIDVLVFDHHECPPVLPDCHALVNPKRGDDFHYLCTAGIIFKVCHALLKTRPLPDFDLKEFLEPAAMATVADLVPLVGENRTLVLRGAERLGHSNWPGIRALMDVGRVVAPVRPVDIGFRMAPRLNAAGRMENARSALELLLTDDPQHAERLAEDLSQANRQRQEVEMGIVQEAETRVEREFDPQRDSALVLGERGWHQGVLGIVASRICRRYHRPTMVIGFDESGQGKGSGRSPSGFCLVTALAQCQEYLENFGGHEMAAGVTLNEFQFPQFRRCFLEAAAQVVDPGDFKPALQIDGQLALRDLNLDLLAQHERLQPFGSGNPQPIFVVSGVVPERPPRILRDRHQLFELRQDGVRYPAIYFKSAGVDLPPPPWDVAFKIERNVFRDRLSLQLQIQSIRSSRPFAA